MCIKYAISMKNRSLVSIDDFSTEEILRILDLTEEFEKEPITQIARRKGCCNIVF